MTVRVRGGGASTALSRARAEQVQELQRTELENVREHALNWRNGLVGVIGLVTAVSVVKGRDTITELARTTQVVIGLLLLASLVAASVGAFLSLRAAYGFPRSRPLDADPVRFAEQRRTRARQASRDLVLAVVCTALTLAALVTAIAVTWYARTYPPAFVEVTDEGSATTCGELLEASGTRMVLRVSGARVVLEQEEVARFRLVRSCGAR